MTILQPETFPSTQPDGTHKPLRGASEASASHAAPSQAPCGATQACGSLQGNGRGEHAPPEIELRRVALSEQARAYIGQAKAPNTLRAYRSDWRHFQAWCGAQHVSSLPADASTLTLYLSAYAPLLRVSTLQRRLSAISQAHQAAGHPTPTDDARVRTLWQGIRRVHGERPRGKQPALPRHLRAIAGDLGDTPAAVRDRALLLLGFAAALRRSELVSLTVGDLQPCPEGLILHLRKSKTDPYGQGRQIGIPYGNNPATCPVRALHAWLSQLGFSIFDFRFSISPTTGASGAEHTSLAAESIENRKSKIENPQAPLFRSINRHGQISAQGLSDRSVALIVKKHVARLGLDPALYAGHSLRAGFATACAQAGVSERAIAQQTGHTSLTTLRRYIRSGTLFQDNACAQSGL